MKKIKMLKKWCICELNEREKREYNFNYAVIHPESYECYYDSGLMPSDTDIECETLDQAIEFINNY